MKVLYVFGFDDYGALTFEQDMDFDVLTAFEKAWNSKGHTFSDDEFGVTFEAYEFGDVDERFVKFIETEIMDYDDAKHCNFYVVPDEATS